MTQPRLREVGVADAVALAREGYRVIDVREPTEWEEGHVAGATLVPLADVPQRIASEVPERDTPLLLYCRSGARSGRAAAWLAQMGYSDVVNLNGFIAEWQAAGGSWEASDGPLTAAQARRYARQLPIPEVGPAGQRRLLDAKVLLIGAGGLGSPAALYLAAAGVGTLGVVDADTVEESNLQRQVLHGIDRIGSSKVDSAEAALHRLNRETRVVKHGERLTASNAERLLGPYDVVVDGSDNVETRYALNDAAVLLRKPVVHGSVYRWEGQVTTLVPFEGPCYRCLHPVHPPAGAVADCNVAGVMGVIPGIVGTLQATEAMKLILGAGAPLIGRLLIVDALTMSFDDVRFARDPACRACGDGAAEAAVPSGATTA